MMMMSCTRTTQSTLARASHYVKSVIVNGCKLKRAYSSGRCLYIIRWDHSFADLQTLLSFFLSAECHIDTLQQREYLQFLERKLGIQSKDGWYRVKVRMDCRPIASRCLSLSSALHCTREVSLSPNRWFDGCFRLAIFTGTEQNRF